MRRLSREFFNRDTVLVARELVGKVLEVDGIHARIIETEAYKQDKASHAYRRTPRSELMYTTYGHVYVYFVYGMYYCLNFTTDRTPGAVLIRALDLEGCEGPGKLCKTLNITKKDNGVPIGRRFKLYDDRCIPEVEASKRIGIRQDAHLEWRFRMKGLSNNWEHKGTKVRFTFYDGNNEEKFRPAHQSYAICFRDDGKIIIGLHPGEYGDWLLPGGRIEKGESPIETLRRELDEELSLELVRYKFLGAQRVEFLNKKRKPHYELRYAAIVKEKRLTPDPDNGLTWKRKAVIAKDFSKHIRWGNIGAHMLRKAVEWYEKQ